MSGVTQRSAPAETRQPTEPDVETLPRESVFHLLSNDRRRHLLHYLLQQEDGATDVRSASRQLAAWENDVPVEEVTPAMRRRVYVALHQSHLPQLRDADVVRYDETRSDIELTERASELRVYLDVVHGDNIPWSEFYLGLGALCGAITVLIWVGVPPLEAVSMAWWAVTIALVMTLVGAIHTYSNRHFRLGREGPPPEVELE